MSKQIKATLDEIVEAVMDIIKCDECEGSGTIYIWDPPMNDDPYAESHHESECHHCDGIGFNVKDKKIEHNLRTALERFVVEWDLRSELIEYDTWSDDNYEIEKKPHERVDKYLSQRTTPKKGGEDE